MRLIRRAKLARLAWTSGRDEWTKLVGRGVPELANKADEHSDVDRRGVAAARRAGRNGILLTLAPQPALERRGGDPKTRRDDRDRVARALVRAHDALSTI